MIELLGNYGLWYNNRMRINLPPDEAFYAALAMSGCAVKIREKEIAMGHGVKLQEIVEKMNLKNLTPEVELLGREVNVPDINRPALRLPDSLIILTVTGYR